MNVLTTEKLLDYCDSDDCALQTEALIQLVDAEVYEAVPKILRLLKSSDELIRSHAAEALGYLGIDEVETVGSALMPLLKDPEKLVRSETVEALGELGYTPAIAHIEYILRNDPSALVRASAAETLGYLEDPKSIATLELSLLDKDEDRAVRGYAANSIGLLGTSQLLPKLEKYLELDLPLSVQAELLAARYWLGAKEDLNKLLSLLENADEFLATIILNILTDLKEREPAPSLAKDAPDLEKVLRAIGLRFSLMRHHAESIMSQ
ncbi:MAG: HEAT repeat domain-containing protein [Oscillatoriaceae cyanobacterium Prado104]|jgi:HEAT repeat protein|nr:HEAT repeat domain-containing protein [Oscillatoriaceae cyanobacterium Prado104]